MDYLYMICHVVRDRNFSIYCKPTFICDNFITGDKLNNRLLLDNQALETHCILKSYTCMI